MKIPPIILKFAAATAAAAIVIGCTHALEITNLGDYFAAPVPFHEGPKILGITSTSGGHIQNSRYVNAVVSALQRTGNFERVIYPYSRAAHVAEADTVVDVTVNAKYSGRGSNFFVNWPGFIIFAPAIWGYGYIAEIDTTATITYQDGESKTLPLRTKYYFREAEFDRTWTEISWLEVSIIAFIGGIAFTSYDPDVTDDFISKVSPYFGPYIANQIQAAL